MWPLIIYLLMSLIVMSVVKPWDDPRGNPIFMTFLCLCIGGAVLIIAILMFLFAENNYGK